MYHHGKADANVLNPLGILALRGMKRNLYYCTTCTTKKHTHLYMRVCVWRKIETHTPRA